MKPRYTYRVETVLNNVVFKGNTIKDTSKFSVRNSIKTKMNLKFGNVIFE